MKATILAGTRDIRLEDRPDPVILAPRDVIVRVVAACVCGSDLWGYRDFGNGTDASWVTRWSARSSRWATRSRSSSVGDFVISPFSLSDGTCQSCLAGSTSVCDHVTFFGSRPTRDRLPVDGAQGELIRMPLGESSLVVVPGPVDDALVPHLLALSDVASTGHHAAVSAHVGPGDVVVVVGDGAVGLSRRARRVAARCDAHHRHEPARRPAGGGPRSSAPPTSSRSAARMRSPPCALCSTATSPTRPSNASEPRSRWNRRSASVRGGGRVGFVGVPATGRTSTSNPDCSTGTSRSAAGWLRRAPTSRSCCPRC